MSGCHIVRGGCHNYSETIVSVTWDEAVIILMSFGACVFSVVKRDTDPVMCYLTTEILAERSIIRQLHHYTKNIHCGYKKQGGSVLPVRENMGFCLSETGSSHLILSSQFHPFS